MNYSDLVQRVADFSETTYFASGTPGTTPAALIDDCIGWAENRIYRDIDLSVTRKYATASLVSGTAFISKPTDCFVVRSIRYLPSSGDSTYLLQKDTSFMQEFWPNRSSANSSYPSIYWSNWDNSTIILAPTPPNSADGVEMAYTYVPPQLSASNTSTWLSTYAADALFYAVMYEVSVFLKQPSTQDQANMSQVYNDRYQKAIADLNQNYNQSTIESYRTGAYA